MSSQALVHDSAIERKADWESKLDLIKHTVAVGATDDELQMFLHQAKRTGLDPLAKQIYFIKRKKKDATWQGTIQTGIDGFRVTADRTGKYAGNDDYEFDDPINRPKWAKARVWKLVGGVRCPFEATARWEQYYPGDAQGWMWQKMPHLMLGKCAEALALRKAFPADLSGLYTFEETEQAGHVNTLIGACARCGKEIPADATNCDQCTNKPKLPAVQAEAEPSAPIPPLPYGYVELEHNQGWALLVRSQKQVTKSRVPSKNGKELRVLEFNDGRNPVLINCWDHKLFAGLDALVGKWILFEFEHSLASGRAAKLTHILAPLVETLEASVKAAEHGEPIEGWTGTEPEDKELPF